MRITAVSYLNTLPFIYGIEQRVALSRCSAAQTAADGTGRGAAADGEGIVLSLEVPAQCAAAAIDGRTDVALVPVAAIPLIPGFSIRDPFFTAETAKFSSQANGRFVPQIITDFCIGAEGAVETVVLLSDTPLKAIRRVYLDAHSRTSVQLVRVLAREHWRIEPQWTDDAGCVAPLLPGEARVAIGDKVFALRAEHRYLLCLDLAQEWQRFTGGLPFVFAAWVACSPAGRNFAPLLNEALAYGVEHIPESITKTVHRSRDFDFPAACAYLTHAIRFDLDDRKRSAMRLFWEKIITPG